MSELLELVTVANAQRMLGGVTYQTVVNLVARGALAERWAFGRRLITRESIERHSAFRGMVGVAGPMLREWGLGS